MAWLMRVSRVDNGVSSRATAFAPRCAAAAALVAIALATCSAGAIEPPPAGWVPEDGLTFGPSIAAVRAPRLGWATAPGAELTYFHRINTPLNFWISAGARLFTDADGVSGFPYAETGLSLLIVNLGIGYGRGFGDARAPRDTIHGFIGVAIPIFTPSRGNLLYVEPYYRPVGALTPERFAVHEFGLMIKWLWMLRPGYSTDEDAIRGSP
jgi:hypothetical protein